MANKDNTASLSLDDLDKEEMVQKEETQPAITEVEKEETDLTEAISKKEDEEEEVEEEDESVEEEEEEKEEKTDTSKKEEEDPEEEEETSEDASAFFEELSAELGYDVNDLEIDYEEDDPLTAKGVKKLLDAHGNKELSNFDQYLKETHPGAYAHFMASMAGQTDEEFFQNKENRIALVPSIQDITDSVDRQRELVKEDLIAKGIKRESILKSTLAQLEEDDELQEEALRVREDKEKVRNARLEELDTKAKEKVQVEQELNQEVDKALGGILKNGVISKGLTLPKEERKKAIEDFKSNLRVENGELFIVQKVDPKEVSTALGKNYFGNKANLDSIIEKKATTKNVVRLRAQVKEENKARGKAQKGKVKAGGSFTPLDEIE